MKRFIHTRLWAMLMNPKHEKKGFAVVDAVLSEFTVELQNYCRGEKDLAERTRTLRFTLF